MMKKKVFSKKFLLAALAVFMLSFTVNAESLWFRAYKYAIKEKTESNRNNSTGWSNWIECDVPIEFQMDDDIIVIYSNKTQIYAIYENMGTYNDRDGGKQQGYYVLDQDLDKGTVRLRITRDGTSQIYIDFNDVGWVYNVVRTK